MTRLMTDLIAAMSRLVEVCPLASVLCPIYQEAFHGSYSIIDAYRKGHGTVVWMKI
jgi:hypothetical protein